MDITTKKFIMLWEHPSCKLLMKRDLGVIVSEDLKWENQCIAVVKKANKILGMIKRKFADRSEETVMAL